MVRAQVQLHKFHNGELVPVALRRKVEGVIRPAIIFVDTGDIPIAPSGNSLSVQQPVEGETSVLGVIRVRATAPGATAVTATLSGRPAQPMEYVGTGWSADFDVPGDEIPNGAKTIVVSATFPTGTSPLTVTRNFTLDFTPVPEIPDDGTDARIYFTNPDFDDPDAFISGTAFPPKFFIDPALQAIGVVKAEWQYGPIEDAGIFPRYAWKTATRIGSTDEWQAGPQTSTDIDLNTGAFDTRLWYIGLSQTQGTSPQHTVAERNASQYDGWWDLGTRVTLADGQVLLGRRMRVIANNLVPRKTGATPTFDPLMRWSQPITNTGNADTDRINYVMHGHYGTLNGVTGGIFGKESEAISIVDDPVPAGTRGHISHGRVLAIHVPMNYHEITRNRQSAYPGGGIYRDPEGDQPTASMSNLRYQQIPPIRIPRGRFVYAGHSFLLDAARLGPGHVDFKQPRNHFSLWQIFQDPYTYGLVQMAETKTLDPNHAVNPPGQISVWGERFLPRERARLFALPMVTGDWVDIIRGIGVSDDGRAGWLELWYRHPDINGGALTQHRFPDGSLRLRAATWATPGSLGVQIHWHLYFNRNNFSSVDNTSAMPARGFFAKLAIGETPAEVDPKSYNPEGS